MQECKCTKETRDFVLVPKKTNNGPDAKRVDVERGM